MAKEREIKAILKSFPDKYFHYDLTIMKNKQRVLFVETVSTKRKLKEAISSFNDVGLKVKTKYHSCSGCDNCTVFIRKVYYGLPIPTSIKLNR